MGVCGILPRMNSLVLGKAISESRKQAVPRSLVEYRGGVNLVSWCYEGIRERSRIREIGIYFTTEVLLVLRGTHAHTHACEDVCTSESTVPARQRCTIRGGGVGADSASKPVYEHDEQRDPAAIEHQSCA